MAIELAYDEAYATSEEADVFLATNETWLGLEDHVKDDALLWARYYIDDNFDCYLYSIDVIPEELKYANSLLAVDYYTDGTLYKSKTDPTVKRKKVKAGDVETEKEYIGGDSASKLPSSINQVRGLLAPICKQITTSGTVNLVRA